MPAARTDRWTLVVCLSRIFLFATFMTVAAVIPLLKDAWAISAVEAGAIVTAFTIAYAVSLFVFGWAADHIGAKRAVQISAVGSALASAAFGFLAHDWTSALLLYANVGLWQGGIYTPLVMLFAERSAPERRGTAMGWLIASTSLGYAFSLAVSGIGIALGGHMAAFVLTGLLPGIGTLILLFALHPLPNRVHRRSPALGLSGALFRNREARLLTAGYTAHSWELLGGWAWMPTLIAASLALSGSGLLDASGKSAWLTAAMHVLGASAAFSIGMLSDRFSRRSVLLGVALAASALSLSIGWLVALPALVLALIGLVHAFLTIGDSPVLTTAITEVVEPGYLGAVLAVRALFGFGAGAVAPIAAGFVLDAAGAADLGPSAAWGLTFGLLGLGGLLAAWCAHALKA
ncbi:MFS transporter [Faunimonas sp. B44]|uniref:MFS transporter n=1 Tax=Faunimonas sp. B44 TaxID=3461493 RepID=UPI0040450C3B